VLALALLLVVGYIGFAFGADVMVFTIPPLLVVVIVALAMSIRRLRERSSR
jgi:hypothetical protein